MISVVVVTFKRNELLKRCLRSILGQDYEGEYEVTVIDDSCQNEINSSLREYFKDKVKFVVNEKEEGLAVNKNKGIRLAKGDIIAFTDDDCIVSKNWLRAIDESLQNYDLVGGKVIPFPDTKFPSWWRESLDWIIGLSPNFGQYSLPLGSNVAFTKIALRELGGYDIRINRKNGNLQFGEDTDIATRAFQRGFRMAVNKDMKVYHYIPKDRLSFSYLFERSYKEGWSWATREADFKIFLLRLAALIVNPVRFLIYFDINHICRMLVSLFYITTYLRVIPFIKGRGNGNK